MSPTEFQTEAARLRPILMQTARRYFPYDEETAEDMVQDALLKLWTMCPQLHTPISGLATVLVRNLAIDHLRRQRPSALLADVSADMTENATNDAIDRMMAIVDTLPGLQQMLLRLRHMQGMEFKDIARLTGSTEAAIRQALSRARKNIRQQYIKQAENER